MSTAETIRIAFAQFCAQVGIKPTKALRDAFNGAIPDSPVLPPPSPLAIEMEFSDSVSVSSRKRRASIGDSYNASDDGTVTDTAPTAADDGFTPVRTKKTRKRASKAASASAVSPTVVGPSPVPLMSLDVSPPSKPASRCAPVPPKVKAPPQSSCETKPNG